VRGHLGHTVDVGDIGREGTATTAQNPSLRTEPVLEVNLESLKHLFFDVFNVGELAPTSHIAVS
jgi:hypothetical protein